MGKPFTGSVTGVYLNKKIQGSGQGLQQLESAATMPVVSIFGRCITQPWALRPLLRWVLTGLEDNHETWFDSRGVPFFNGPRYRYNPFAFQDATMLRLYADSLATLKQAHICILIVLPLLMAAAIIEGRGHLAVYFPI